MGRSSDASPARAQVKSILVPLHALKLFQADNRLLKEPSRDSMPQHLTLFTPSAVQTSLRLWPVSLIGQRVTGQPTFIQLLFGDRWTERATDHE